MQKKSIEKLAKYAVPLKSSGRFFIEKRTDDDLDTILKRYDTYMKTTKPVLDFYSKNSNFYEIDGTLEIDKITSKIDAFLNV